MSFASVAVGIGTAVVGAGVSAALSPGAPSVNLDSGAGAKATAATLPYQRQLAAAMQQGTVVDIPTGRMTDQVTQMVRLPRTGPGRGDQGQLVPYNPADWQEGGKYAQFGQPNIISKKQRVPEVIHADFTGYGDADTQAKIADQMAQIYLDLGNKYGPQFIEEAKKQLALADPEGTAAREKLFELTQQQAAKKPISPVANMLKGQIGDELAAGGNLTADQAATLDTASAEAADGRGTALNSRILRNTMESGPEFDARRAATERKALGWLTSGATPEDVDYRATQQNLANLSNFTQGRTPTSQFASLSNAQRGATPMTTAQPGPQINPNVNQQFNQVQLGGWGTQLQNAASQANPWMAGLTTLISGANAVAAGRNH